MSDKPPPLPRFRPNPPSGGSAPKRTMSNSISMPNMAVKKTTQQRAPPPKRERVPRAPQLIDFGPTVAPIRKTGETFNAPPLTGRSKSLITGAADIDALESDTNLAVTLPLVPPVKNIQPPGEILTLSPMEVGQDKVMLVQLPSSLPIQYPNDSVQMEYNPLFAAADGHIGKLFIHQSGKVTAKIGNTLFDVSTGVAPSCNQLVCVKRDNDRIEYFPVSGNKIKFTVDVKSLLDHK